MLIIVLDWSFITWRIKSGQRVSSRRQPRQTWRPREACPASSASSQQRHSTYERDPHRSTSRDVTCVTSSSLSKRDAIVRTIDARWRRRRRREQVDPPLTDVHDAQCDVQHLANGHLSLTKWRRLSHKLESCEILLSVNAVSFFLTRFAFTLSKVCVGGLRFLFYFALIWTHDFTVLLAYLEYARYYQVH